MSLRLIVRKMFLAFVLGSRVALGGISREEIEAILHSMNQTKVEVTIPEQDDQGEPGQ